MSDVDNSRARYWRILRFAIRYIAQAWWYELFLPRIGLARLAARGRAARLENIARRFHVLAVELGGLMIKVGQFMSSRLDVLPPEITKELEGLQDEVPAVPFDAIRRAVERELGMPIDRAYASFDQTPLAAASLGQAHRVRLTPLDAADTGLDQGVVKVQRPGIDAIVEVDLSALRRVAGWLSRVRIVADHVDLPALVEEFAHTSHEEIDYIHEAGNAERFAANFAGDARVDSPAGGVGAHDQAGADPGRRHRHQDQRCRCAAGRRDRSRPRWRPSSPPSCSTSSSRTATSTPIRIRATSSSRRSRKHRRMARRGG